MKILEINKCKNKKCQKILPEGYKYKYCEACQIQKVKHFKDTGKAVLSCVGIVSIVVIVAMTKGKNK